MSAQAECGICCLSVCENRRASSIDKGGLYGNVVRTGVMLNSITDSIDKVIEVLDADLALC